MKLTECYNNNWLIPEIQIKENQDCSISSLDFVLINKNISIKIIHLQDNILANEVLKQVAKQTPNCSIGFLVEFHINGKQSVKGSPIEYVIFNVMIKIINDYFIKRNWDYIIFSGNPGESTTLHNGIAQRLTITQPNVERFVHLNARFLISRF